MVEENIKFIFTCPTQSKTFESSDFKIVDNQGVITDETGNKTLNARVALNEPCPHCGRKHMYHAGEIACPFENSEGRGNS
jgi:hypothetical protein